MRLAGGISIIALLCAWLALDDITTDNATEFNVEYSLLLICGVWFAGVSVWLLVRGRLVLGIVSLLAVALAVVAFWSLPHHYAPASLVNYLGLLTLAWFLGLAVWMVARREWAVKTTERKLELS
jgi:hypothetical protein